MHHLKDASGPEKLINREVGIYSGGRKTFRHVIGQERERGAIIQRSRVVTDDTKQMMQVFQQKEC